MSHVGCVIKNAEPIGPAGGDLSGTYPDPTVSGLEDYPIEPAPPTNGDALLFNGATNQWEHSPIVFGGGPPVGPAGGDLAGLYPDPSVDGLLGDPLPASTANGFLKRNTSNTGWEEVLYGSSVNTVCQGNDVRLSNARTPTGSAGGDLTGTYPNPSLITIGAAGTYGNSTSIPVITTDTKGRITNVTVTSVAAKTPDIVIWPTHPIQLLSVSEDQLLPIGTYHRFTCAGNVTITSAPSINWPSAVVGQVVILHNVGAPGTGHLTIQAGVTYAFSLSNSNKRIDEGGTMMLVYNGSIWTEVTHTQATST